MREISCSAVMNAVRDMCIEINLKLDPETKARILAAEGTEKDETGKTVLKTLLENLEIAGRTSVPICQDTGMAVVFIRLGQEVHVAGGSLADAVNEGVRRGYTEGYLRKSVVGDPILRKNTGNNTPAVIYYDLVPGDVFEIRVMAKGFGSENTSRVFMLKPADGLEGVENAVLTAVQDAGPNACPPMFIGVGIGGTFEKAALLAKEALFGEEGETEEPPYVRELEERLLRKINALGIGPAGLGGDTTALSLHVLTYPTHIAGLPLAVNICCHVNRHAKRVL